MSLKDSAVRGLAKLFGEAITPDDADPDVRMRPYNLIITIPIKAPNKRIVQDTLTQAAKRVSGMSSVLMTAANIDPRVQIDGDPSLTVEGR